LEKIKIFRYQDIMNIRIGGHAIDHSFQVMQGLNEDAIVGIDFCHKHKMIHDSG
jgi:hypothetical protein